MTTRSAFNDSGTQEETERTGRQPPHKRPLARQARLSAIFAIAQLIACDNRSDAAESAGALETSSEAETGEPQDCIEDDFAPAGPFAGPGWDAKDGLIGERQAKYYAHSTWIKISTADGASDKFNQAFGAAAAEVLTSDGLIGVQFGGSAKCRTGRTMGVWRDQASMLRYVASAPHIAAIAAMGEFTDDSDTTSWAIAGSDLPLTFDTAISRLGR